MTMSGDQEQRHRELYRRLLAAERGRSAAHDYAGYHRRRFDYVVGVCRRVRPDPGARVLDVGRSALSHRLLAHYADVTTLGFAPSPDDAVAPDAAPPADRVFAAHLVCDLNDAARTGTVDGAGRYDLVVFAEVLEHLHAAPELVLHLLRGLLADDGLLVCQTPNAAALPRRLRLLAGRHPYERLRVNPGNPGHIREYTRDELVEIAAAAGLHVVRHEYADYFGAPRGGPAAAAATAALKLAGTLWPSLRRGQTAVLRRAGRRP